VTHIVPGEELHEVLFLDVAAVYKVIVMGQTNIIRQKDTEEFWQASAHNLRL
jgi:hypothetical protein